MRAPYPESFEAINDPIAREGHGEFKLGEDSGIVRWAHVLSMDQAWMIPNDWPSHRRPVQHNGHVAGETAPITKHVPMALHDHGLASIHRRLDCKGQISHSSAYDKHRQLESDLSSNQTNRNACCKMD